MFKQKSANANQKFTPKGAEIEQDFILSYDEAETLLEDPMNGVEEINLHGKLAILPGDLQIPDVKIGQLLNTKLFHYLPAAGGILMAYCNLKLAGKSAAIFNERPFAHVSYSARAIVLKLEIGKKLRGVVSQLSSIKRHVTCVLCGAINVSIPLEDQQSHTSPYRIGDVICFELSSHMISPNGTVSLTGRKCEISELVSLPVYKKPRQLHSASTITADISFAKANRTPQPQPQHTPTWLKSATQKTQLKQSSAQRIVFDSSSDSSSSDSDNDSMSESLGDDDIPIKMSPKSVKSLKTTPASFGKSLVSKLEQEENDEDANILAKLEPMTPSRCSFDISGKLQQQQSKSSKKRKYLAD